MDTAGISGATGNIDLTLANGGGLFQNATATITLFGGTGTLQGSPVSSGDVTGNLPGTLTIGNTTGFNDYFQGFLFGSAFHFRLTLDGPALTAPNGTSTAGSTFGLALYNDTGDTPLLTSDPNGFLGTVDINLNGSTTLTTFPAQAGSPAVATFTLVEGTQSPEPATLSLCAVVLFAMSRMRTGRRQ